MTTRAFNVAAALFALGVAIGTAVDRAPPRVVATRAGYRVLEADFHAHTRMSDGLLPPFDLVLEARRRGLDALAITEHNTTSAAKLGAWFSKAIHGPTILIGEEVTTNRYHVIAVGLTETVKPELPLPKLIEAIHAQGGVAIAAHPVRHFWDRLVPNRALFDGTEVMHPIAYRSSSAWSWRDMRTFYEASLDEGHPLAAIGSSDYHFGSILGVTRTLVFAKDDSPDAILDAIRARRTVVFDLEGEPYGDPEMIAALAKDPYELRRQDYAYEGDGALDKIGRTLGWLGLLGLVFVRARRGAS